MTAVCYANGVLACDSQMSTGNELSSGNAKKIFENDQVMIGIAGQYALCLKIAHWVLETGGDRSQMPALDGFDDIMYELIVVDKVTGDCWTYEGGNLDMVPIYAPIAIGSGGPYALGALKLQKMLKMPEDPVQAIRVAIKSDVYTGGPIKTMKINRKKAKKKAKTK